MPPGASGELGEARLLERAEGAYRDAWRTATGSETPAGLTDACAGWLLRGDGLVERARRQSTDHLARIPHKDTGGGAPPRPGNGSSTGSAS